MDYNQLTIEDSMHVVTMLVIMLYHVQKVPR